MTLLKPFTFVQKLAQTHCQFFFVLFLLPLFILGVTSLSGCVSTFKHCPRTPLIKGLINQQPLMDDISQLSSDNMQGRLTGTPGNQLAQAYIADRYAEIGLKSFSSDYVQRFQYGLNNQKSGTNLIGYITGTRYPNKYIVLSAHYDHIGHQGNTIFNGADDNASGVAAMISLASYFIDHLPQHSIIFLASDAEENGLNGAKAFVTDPPVSINKIQYNVNLDMVARGKKNELIVAGTRVNLPLRDLILMNALQYGVCVKPGHEGIDRSILRERDNIDWSNASDHAPFDQANIPYLYFGVSPHKDYHQAGDTADKIDQRFYTAAVEAILITLTSLDKLD